jgi:hypothetical protein|tara:strand:+ start:3733 stop:4467 length:735 start_codon:yes stop_codon:yes gene_type:complete
MKFPTWEELLTHHCTVSRYSTPEGSRRENYYHESFAVRRFNVSSGDDTHEFRFVFLKAVLENVSNSTLCRHGRFIWCRNLRYEGVSDLGYRQVSFTVDQGKKRFRVSENNMLCIPSKIFVSNNRFFRTKDKTFMPFSSAFSYSNSVKAMALAENSSAETLLERIERDSPFKPGTLVVPRVGYFYPAIQPELTSTQSLKHSHPCGIILGPSLVDDYIGRELYRVRFGATTYEKVHPIQMEIINAI